MNSADVTWPKRKFDPKNLADLRDYQYFRTNRKWDGNCPFELEWPYLNVPEMIVDRLINQYFDVMLKETNGKKK